MIVQALVNLSNGQGKTLRAGSSGEVSEELAALYIRRGFAVPVEPKELASRATEILEEFDDLPKTKRTWVAPTVTSDPPEVKAEEDDGSEDDDHDGFISTDPDDL